MQRYTHGKVPIIVFLYNLYIFQPLAAVVTNAVPFRPVPWDIPRTNFRPRPAPGETEQRDCAALMSPGTAVSTIVPIKHLSNSTKQYCVPDSVGYIHIHKTNHSSMTLTHLIHLSLFRGILKPYRLHRRYLSCGLDFFICIIIRNYLLL